MIEIAVFFVGHHSVVAPVFFQQLRVIIIASRIEGLLLYLFKVGLLDLYLPLVFRSLRLGGTFGCRYVAALLRLGVKVAAAAARSVRMNMRMVLVFMG